MGFAPVGEVVLGPYEQRIIQRGNTYLRSAFPWFDPIASGVVRP
jgi:hypothetical protein